MAHVERRRRQINVVVGNPDSLRSRLKIFVPLILIAAIFILCFIWPAVFRLPNAVGGNIRMANLPPLSAGHLLGTDVTGNDIWARLLRGGRSSLTIAFTVNTVGLMVGGILGSVAAYLGHIADSMIMRALDVILAFPPLVLMLTIAHALGASYSTTILSLMFYSIPAFARLARAATLRIKEHSFIMSAKISHGSIPRILCRHVAPIVLPQMATYALLGMGIVMLLEGGLSFLGLGIQLPEPSWGNMIYEGQQSISTRPLLIILPSSFLFLTVLSFNLLGEALREVWNTSI